MDNSIETINNSVKKVGSLDDLLDFSNKSNKSNKNIYIPKCLCGYNNINLIGSGAFSIVFSAYHLLDKNTEALKCITLPDKKQVIKEKSREILFLSRLCHPNIIRYYNSWLEYIPNTVPKFITNHISEIILPDENIGVFLFIQMEKINITLKKNLDNKSYLKSNTLKLCISDLLLQLINGLDYLHSNKVVHCDLKPDNIALKYENNEWKVKIMDFGIASVVGIKNMDYKYYGSTLYIPPEMDKIDYLPHYSTDIYSLGIIIFELLNSFSTESEKIQKMTEWKQKKEKIDFLDKIIDNDKFKRPSLKEIKKKITHEKWILLS
jgi:serine/threonine protein kinase